ncbi:MAG TPA: FAD-dependent oxidoreductase, partial [Vicinamibacterales bacterium]|nr:FAD-dependent oxidoreductase [Vicinamibacterales bacterium]
MSRSLASPGKDVIVVGAGIIGCCIALEMCRAGFKTLTIDTLGGAGQGPTSSSAGIVRTFASRTAAIQ